MKCQGRLSNNAAVPRWPPTSKRRPSKLSCGFLVIHCVPSRSLLTSEQMQLYTDAPHSAQIRIEWSAADGKSKSQGVIWIKFKLSRLKCWTIRLVLYHTADKPQYNSSGCLTPWCLIPYERLQLSLFLLPRIKSCPLLPFPVPPGTGRKQACKVAA